MIAEVFGEMTLAGTIRQRAHARGGAAIRRVQLVDHFIADAALITTIATPTIITGITGQTTGGRSIRGIHDAIIPTAIEATISMSIVPGITPADPPGRRWVPLRARQRGYHDV